MKNKRKILIVLGSNVNNVIGSTLGSPCICVTSEPDIKKDLDRCFGIPIAKPYETNKSENHFKRFISKR